MWTELDRTGGTHTGACWRSVSEERVLEKERTGGAYRNVVVIVNGFNDRTRTAWDSFSLFIGLLELSALHTLWACNHVIL
jgi:hypothetical protein